VILGSEALSDLVWTRYANLLVNVPLSLMLNPKRPCVVGPCHHDMARPQVADRGTASNMEGSCE